MAREQEQENPALSMTKQKFRQLRGKFLDAIGGKKSNVDDPRAVAEGILKDVSDVAVRALQETRGDAQVIEVLK